jgi:hypothetical protein
MMSQEEVINIPTNSSKLINELAENDLRESLTSSSEDNHKRTLPKLPLIKPKEIKNPNEQENKENKR